MTTVLRRLARRAAACAHCSALALLATACADEQGPSDDPMPSAPSTSPSESSGRLRLPKNPDLLVVAGPGGVPEQRGSGEVEILVSTLEGGEVTAARGRGAGTGLRFPTFRAEGAYGRAVVVAKVAPGDLSLDPGLPPFSWGADVVVDPESAGRTEDNGNNVVQRGLSSDAVMFKLETDAQRRPSCTAKGRAGSLTVTAQEPVQAGTWYRLRCEARTNRLRILVSEYLPSGGTTTVGREVDGPLGGISFIGQDVPFSVGGKVAFDGTVIASATDQFNGAIDNAFVRIP